jgi:hypothetical protein
VGRGDAGFEAAENSEGRSPTFSFGHFEARLNSSLTHFLPGLNRLREKSERSANAAKDGLAGAKVRLILLILSARLKSTQRLGPVAGDPDNAVPLLQSSVEFFRSL